MLTLSSGPTSMREIISSGLHSITLATQVRRILFSFCLRTAQKWTRRPSMEEHRWWELLRAQERLWWNCLFPKGGFGITTSENSCVLTCNLHVNFSTIVELGEWCLIDGGAKSKMNRACRISVTTLWAASTRHRHSEKTMETKNAHRMLTLKKRGSGGPGEKLNEISPAAKNKRNEVEWLDIQSRAVKIMNIMPLHNPPGHPAHHPEGDCWPAVLFCV